jgi:hypothetical protein
MSRRRMWSAMVVADHPLPGDRFIPSCDQGGVDFRAGGDPAARSNQYTRMRARWTSPVFAAVLIRKSRPDGLGEANNRGEHRVQPSGAEQAACQRKACPKDREEGDRAADDMGGPMVPVTSAGFPVGAPGG